jgi:hypothetical protein
VNRILNVANTFRERGGGHVGLGDTWAWENRGWNRQDLQLSWLKLVLVCVKSYMRVWQWWCILERPALFCFRPLDPAWSCNQPLDSTLKELRAAVAQLLLHACSLLVASQSSSYLISFLSLFFTHHAPTTGCIIQAIIHQYQFSLLQLASSFHT